MTTNGQCEGREFSESLDKHIKYVQIAGGMIGVPTHLLGTHDESKRGLTEFSIYARHFFGGGDPENFPAAWLHHIHNNPHHWQHWVFPDGWHMDGSAMDGACVEMPHDYTLEMVADWMGASMAYTGSWDMTDWLSKNIPRISIHSKTAELIRETLGYLEYTDAVLVKLFKSGV